MNPKIYHLDRYKKSSIKSGFRKVKFFGDLNGSPYDRNAKRLVALAKK